MDAEGAFPFIFGLYFCNKVGGHIGSGEPSDRLEVLYGEMLCTSFTLAWNVCVLTDGSFSLWPTEWGLDTPTVG